MQAASSPSGTTASSAAAQLEAARIALTGKPRERLKLGWEALQGLLDDPDDTHQIFRLGMAVNAQLFPRFLMRFVTHEEGAWLLEHEPAIGSAEVAALRALPPHTLGGAYARFLDARDLDPDLFQSPPGLPVVVRYVSQRMRQTHDLWHVLTGIDTSVEGELLLQAFTYGQTRMPSAALVAIAGALRYGSREHRLLPKAFDAYKRGRRAAWMPPLVWERRWEEPVEDLQRALGIEVWEGAYSLSAT